MAREQPYSGTSQARLVRLINTENSKNLVHGVDFVFGSMTEYTDPAGRNTQIQLLAKPGTRYEDSEVFYYRIPVSVLDDLPEEELTEVLIPSLPFSTHQLIGPINAALGLNLTLDEVVDEVFTEKASKYALTINGSKSLAWLDSSIEFKARHVDDPAPLSEAITNDNLDGLVYN